jgi:uncharacterized protein (TIGR00288 family)
VDHDPSSSVRIAVLIDADNTSPKYAEALLEELAKYGTPTIKRAYGDFSSQRLSGWTRELNARAIRAIHQNAFTVGKNSTDSALIIDAMDLLYAGNVEAFALVSSDSDFTGLALRLRESGKVVYGLGRQRTPQSLQNACDRFIALEVLGEEPAEASAERVEDATGSPTESNDDAPQLNLESILTRAVNATADDEGWSSVSAIGNHLSRTQASFDPRNFGHAKLSSLVSAQPYLESQTEGRQILVRLAGRPAKAPKSAPSKQAGSAQTSSKQAAKSTESRSTESEQASTESTQPAQAAEKPAARRAARQPAKKATRAKKAAPSEPADTSTEPPAQEQPATAEPTGAAPESPEPEASRPTVTKTARKRTATRSAAAASAPATDPFSTESAPQEPAKPVVTRRTRTPRKSAAATES